MFDISFGKLVLIMVIALVVLGPERLPKAMKSVANWIKTFRRLSANIQLEISKELKLQELQDSLKKIEQNELYGLSPELKASIDELKQAAQSIQNDFSNVETNMKLNEELPNLNDAITNLNKNLEKNFHLKKERNDNLGKDNNA